MDSVVIHSLKIDTVHVGRKRELYGYGNNRSATNHMVFSLLVERSHRAESTVVSITALTVTVDCASSVRERVLEARVKTS